MYKKKLKLFQVKYPYIEAIFLFLLGNSSGFFINLLAGDISNNRLVQSWSWVNSPSLWISLVLIAAGVIYYVFFSSYCISKKLSLSDKAEEALKRELAEKAKKLIRSPGTTFEESILIYDITMQTVHKNDKS